MHDFFRAANVSALQKAQFAAAHLPEPLMTPHEAGRQLKRNNVDYLPIDEIEGPRRRHAVCGLSSRHRHHRAGRTLDERARPMVDYLKVFERSSNLFPGFDTEVQGIYRERDEAGAVRFYTYVVRE